MGYPEVAIANASDESIIQLMPEVVRDIRIAKKTKLPLSEIAITKVRALKGIKETSSTKVEIEYID